MVSCGILDFEKMIMEIQIGKMGWARPEAGISARKWAQV